MKCSGCGFENAAGIKFCGECGAPLKLKCPSCGFENALGIKFCGECGKSLADPGAPVRSPDPRSYTPHHLAEKILTTRSALEGERKQVTVLFADVKGSMELAESVDPEDWHRIMERFFKILSDGVHRFEGTVNQYTGDGIMALFGAPIAHEDHAQRACYTVLSLQQDLRRYANELRLEKGINFSVRMGLNSGEVVREDWRRSPDGLHGARAYGEPRGADGANRRTGKVLPPGAHGKARQGIGCAQEPRAARNQRPEALRKAS